MKTGEKSDIRSSVIVFNEREHVGGMQQLINSLELSFNHLKINSKTYNHKNFFSSLRFILKNKNVAVFWSFYGNLSPLLILVSRLLGNKNYFLSYGPIVDPTEKSNVSTVRTIKKKLKNTHLIVNHFLFLLFSTKVLHISFYEKRITYQRKPFSFLKFKSGNVIYPAIAETRQSRKTKEGIKRHLGLNPDSKVLLAIGRLERRKNIEDSLLVLKTLIQKGVQNIQFVYLFPNSHYSDFHYLSVLTSQVEKYSLGPYVKFLTAFSNQERNFLYSAADAYLMTSKNFESFGFVTLEALKAGCPVFGYNSSATPEILRENSKEYLVNTGDISGLSRKINKYLALTNHQRMLISEKMRMSVKTFSIPQMAAQIRSFMS